MNEKHMLHLERPYLFSKIHMCDAKIAKVADLAQFGYLSLAFSLFRSHVTYLNYQNC